VLKDCLEQAKIVRSGKYSEEPLQQEQLPSEPGLTRTEEIVRQAVDFMRQNYQKPLTLEEVARIVYLSPAYFSAVFKNQAGISFSRYLNKIRVDKAKELLTGSERSVFEVARAVGYLEGNYFCRVFKKLTGTTPGNYRRS
jgi:two-component system response regulator YesN